jgi:surface antigen
MPVRTATGHSGSGLTGRELAMVTTRDGSGARLIRSSTGVWPTSFVAWRMNHQYGIAFTNGMRGGHWGNANQWPANARDLGYPVNGTPTVGAIAEFNIGTNGHVTLVAQVNGNGTITIEEYNFNPAFGYSVRTMRSPR